MRVERRLRVVDLHVALELLLLLAARVVLELREEVVVLQLLLVLRLELLREARLEAAPGRAEARRVRARARAAEVRREELTAGLRLKHARAAEARRAVQLGALASCKLSAEPMRRGFWSSDGSLRRSRSSSLFLLAIWAAWSARAGSSVSCGDATRKWVDALSCWTLLPIWNVATASTSSVCPRADSGTSPCRTLSSHASHSGKLGDMNDASIAALEHCGSHTRGAHCHVRPTNATDGAVPLMQRVNSRKSHFLSGIFLASTVQMWLPLDCARKGTESVEHEGGRQGRR